MQELTAISKAIVKVEKVVIAYKKEAGDYFRKKEVDRNYGEKAILLLFRLNRQYDEILRDNWNKGVFI
jgi:hypothetical protein